VPSIPPPELRRPNLIWHTDWGAAYGSNPVNNGGLSRKHVIEGVDAALARLQLDYVDLVYAHRPDRNTPIEETVRAFNHIINTGKAFYWGTSEWNADEIATAWRYADKLGLIGPLMEQPQYNMLARQRVEFDYAPFYEPSGPGLGLTVFSPLKMGILTGKYNDGIPEGSRLTQTSEAFIKDVAAKRVETEEWKLEIAKVRKLKTISDKLGMTQGTLAMAWVLANKNVSSAITGASRPEQCYEAVKAIDAYKLLTPEIMEEIETILDNKPVPLTRRF
jgi:aryl-alcohol dehydrogenase-like predicted oxidoreductase